MFAHLISFCACVQRIFHCQQNTADNDEYQHEIYKIFVGRDFVTDDANSKKKHKEEENLMSKSKNHFTLKMSLTGAYEQEHATTLYSCDDVFIVRFIFR